MTQEAKIPEVLPPENGSPFAEWKLTQVGAEMGYETFKASMEAKIHGAAGRESMEKLIRVLHLRQVKEKLTPLGQWARWCQETGIDARNADYEISKLGDWKDDLLTKFVSYAGIPLNKIRALTNGDLQKLQITTGNNQIIVNGEPVPLDQEEMQFVVDSLQDNIKRAELKAEEEKKALEEDAAAMRKALKKAQKELNNIKGAAQAKGLTLEEETLLRETDSIREDFDKLMLRIEGLVFIMDEPTHRMVLARETMFHYIKQQIDAMCLSAVPAQAGKGEAA